MGRLGLHHTLGLLGSPIHWLLRNTLIQRSLGVPGKDLEREGEGKARQRTEGRKQKQRSEDRGQKAKGREKKAEGKGQKKAEGRGHRAELAQNSAAVLGMDLTGVHFLLPLHPVFPIQLLKGCSGLYCSHRTPGPQPCLPLSIPLGVALGCCAWGSPS